ncbi:MAG: hypothetical protein IRZ06_12225 [Nevskia sp.]|nr:hypothetical protein [Nevskia sp.]
MITTNTATDKQVAYALALLERAGYDLRHMDRRYAALGATMRVRSSMTPEEWLRSLTRREISEVIDGLTGR